MPARRQRSVSRRTPVSSRGAGFFSSYFRSDDTHNLNVAVTVHLVVCSLYAVLLGYLIPFIHMNPVEHFVAGKGYNEYVMFSYAFLPFVLFASLCWWWHRFMSQRGLTSGQVFKAYLVVSLFLSFILGFMYGHESKNVVLFSTVFLHTIYMLFLPALMSTLLYAFSYKRILELSQRLEKF